MYFFCSLFEAWTATLQHMEVLNVHQIIFQLNFTLQDGIEALRILLLEGFDRSATFVNSSKKMEQTGWETAYLEYPFDKYKQDRIARRYIPLQKSKFVQGTVFYSTELCLSNYSSIFSEAFSAQWIRICNLESSGTSMFRYYSVVFY